METITTTNVWIIAAIAFIIGLFAGYIVLRATKGSVQKQLQLEADLKATKAKVEEQKVQLEQHFSQSADLLATLAADYKKLYTHLAKSSEQLLPDAAKQIEFFKQEQLVQKSVEKDQPKDYSEGSSGLLKQQ
ncbi:hypothetical protein A4G20_04440 [Pasteurellaceae bacterium RH1A]|nr:hypothetical protein A4G20_04440 [Pasteurellaceae bacterium RH1A]